MCAVFVKFTTVERNSVSDYFTKIVKVKSIKVKDVVDEVVDEEVDEEVVDE